MAHAAECGSTPCTWWTRCMSAWLLLLLGTGSNTMASGERCRCVAALVTHIKG